MKISNFKFQRLTGENCLDWKAFATVDVKRLFRKVETKEICRNFFGDWHFTDNGEDAPFLVLHHLTRAWEAKNGDIFTKENNNTWSNT